MIDISLDHRGTTPLAQQVETVSNQFTVDAVPQYIACMLWCRVGLRLEESTCIAIVSCYERHSAFAVSLPYCTGMSGYLRLLNWEGMASLWILTVL